jgi:hypothetical protein
MESYFGFETSQPLEPEFIKRLLESDEVRPVDYLYQIDQNQRLWLSPDAEIWLASANDPLGDARKVLVDKLDSRYIPAVVWEQAAKTENLAQSLILRNSIDRHMVEAYPGDYLRSREYLDGTYDIKHPESYFPYWQKHLAQRIVADARGVADVIHAPRPSLSILPYQEHDYRNVEEAIVSRRVALPCEVIFQTSRRMRSLSILPFGNIQYFALVYLPDSLIESDLELRSEEVFAGRFNDWIDRLIRLEIRVCAPTHTAVDDLLTDAVTERVLPRTLKDDENKVSKLARWIVERDSYNAVIACDTGIAYQLLALARKDGGKIAKLRFARVRYEEPMSCGMAYVNGDEVWGNYLKRAISDEFQSPDEQVRDSLDEFRGRFEQMDGIWAAPGTELRIQ